MKVRTKPALKKAPEGANGTTVKLSVRVAIMSKADRTNPTRIGNTRVANQAKAGQVRRKPRRNERRKGCEEEKNCANKKVELERQKSTRKRLCQRQWSPPRMRVMMKSLKSSQVQMKIAMVLMMLRPELLSVDALPRRVPPWMKVQFDLVQDPDPLHLHPEVPDQDHDQVHPNPEDQGLVQLDREAHLDQSLGQGQSRARGHLHLQDLDQVHLLDPDQVHLLDPDQVHLLDPDQVHLLLQDPVRLRPNQIKPKIRLMNKKRILF